MLSILPQYKEHKISTGALALLNLQRKFTVCTVFFDHKCIFVCPGKVTRVMHIHKFGAAHPFHSRTIPFMSPHLRSHYCHCTTRPVGWPLCVVFLVRPHYVCVIHKVNETTCLEDCSAQRDGSRCVVVDPKCLWSPIDEVYYKVRCLGSAGPVCILTPRGMIVLNA